MPLDVSVIPGFPLPMRDYAAMQEELERYDDLHGALTVAHSLGSISAMTGPTASRTVLLAPSVPQMHRRRRALIACLLGAIDRTPWSDAVARGLRAGTYRRYGGRPPVGEPLRLAAAASQLQDAAVRRADAAPPECIVICSKTDPRRESQSLFARTLNAEVLWIEGGHLFPITNPLATAALIADALRG